MGYSDNDDILPLCISLPQMIGYVMMMSCFGTCTHSCPWFPFPRAEAWSLFT